MILSPQKVKQREHNELQKSSWPLLSITADLYYYQHVYEDRKLFPIKIDAMFEGFSCCKKNQTLKWQNRLLLNLDKTNFWKDKNGSVWFFADNTRRKKQVWLKQTRGPGFKTFRCWEEISFKSINVTSGLQDREQISWCACDLEETTRLNKKPLSAALEKILSVIMPGWNKLFQHWPDPHQHKSWHDPVMASVRTWMC